MFYKQYLEDQARMKKITAEIAAIDACLATNRETGQALLERFKQSGSSIQLAKKLDDLKGNDKRLMKRRKALEPKLSYEEWLRGRKRNSDQEAVQRWLRAETY